MSSEGTHRILIVDDQPNWRLALRVLLESEGYHVSDASDFQQAKEILNRSLFDLAVLDVRLVDEEIFNVQGLELLQFIKEHTPSTKTVVLTGYLEEGEIEADAMLLKVPDGATFDSKGFKMTVRNLLEMGD